MRVLTVGAAVALLLLGGTGAAARGAGWWPVPGHVIAEFDPPDPDWLPGHRGLDLSAPAGSAVLAPRAGVVTFAGPVGGTPTLVVAHGVIRATYQPVAATAATGTAVAAGQPVGVLRPGGHCPADCLHWGARVNGRYVDPRILLGAVRVVLLPD